MLFRSKELDLPIAVHSRDAAKDTFDLIAARGKNQRGVIHCYSYSPEMAQEYVKLGYHIGLGGVVTFKNAKKAKETARQIPLERILLETDCPYMAPTPFRGKRNNSAYIDYVAQEIAELERKGVEYESIAVPVSPVLIIQENFVDTVQSMIQKYQIPSGKLAVEIDEYALTTSPVIIEIVMQQLKELGVELILNNFGSGYSGISKILELPVDTLKFERMFMWQLETNPKSEPIVECLIKASDKLGKRLIAEGVETQRQLDILEKFGCIYQQGFYYSPTIPQELLASQ